jgi:hypothetical protein
MRVSRRRRRPVSSRKGIATTIQCYKNAATLVLKARYELLDQNTTVEETTLENGTPVSRSCCIAPATTDRRDDDRSFDDRPQNVPKLKNVVVPRSGACDPQSVGTAGLDRLRRDDGGIPRARLSRPSSTDSERRPCAMSQLRRTISVPSRATVTLAAKVAAS